jgi:catechol 2,3-dioxygenase-like lactoylglutathione lyase family enzyme
MSGSITPPAPPAHGLHHAAYRCRDAEETRRFYEDMLGLPLTHTIRESAVVSTGEPCEFVHLFFSFTDGSAIAFFDLGDGEAAEPSPNTPIWVNHIAFKVASMDDLRAMKARVVAHGIEVRGEIDHDSTQSIYFFDPNGIRLEFAFPSRSEEQAAEDVRDAHAILAQWVAEKPGRERHRAEQQVTA